MLALKMNRPKKARFLQNGMVDQKNVLTKCLLLLEKCPWNGTWVKPFHSGNVHRDIFLFLASCAHLFFLGFF
jgi:hypothetical protein